MVVVVAVDRSERARNAVAEAVKIAAAFDDPLHVVHVLGRSEFVNLEQTEVEKSGQPVEMDKVRRFAAEQAEKATEGANISTDVEYVGLVGDAAGEIVDYAANQNARYIVVAPRKKSPTGKTLFGSVAQKVLLNADCPVVTTISE